MFTHKGKGRTYAHNLKLASVLSFVAGMVNITGFFSVSEMTSNITGHFVFFTEHLLQANYWKSISYIFFVVFFLLGAFTSNFLTETIRRRKHTSIYTIPALIEAFILIYLSIRAEALIEIHVYIVAFAFLFCMGFQNSMVTSISNSIVRTTHLTGLFTDLGIELSQWFFYREAPQRKKLKKSIFLRSTIIAFFLKGALCGGILYPKLHFFSLLIPSAMLLIILLYDYIRILIQKNNPHN